MKGQLLLKLRGLEDRLQSEKFKAFSEDVPPRLEEERKFSDRITEIERNARSAIRQRQQRME